MNVPEFNTTYCYSIIPHMAITPLSRQLLMIAMELPEIFWAVYKEKKVPHKVISSWFCYLHWIEMHGQPHIEFYRICYSYLISCYKQEIEIISNEICCLLEMFCLIVQNEWNVNIVYLQHTAETVCSIKRNSLYIGLQIIEQN